MNVAELRTSIRQLKRNLAKLKNKENQSPRVKRDIERTENKVLRKVGILESLGVPEKTEPRKKKTKVQFKFGDYKKYICSPDWEAKKKLYYANHEKVCRSCGSDEREMHLHHRSYARIYNEADNDLMPLCSMCHSALHLFQKTFGIPVEDATSIWIGITNGNSKKKKIREALRSASLESFKFFWSKKPEPNVNVRVQLAKAVEAVCNSGLIANDYLISDREVIEKKVAFASRTGIVNGYDATVDKLIVQLERGPKRKANEQRKFKPRKQGGD